MALARIISRSHQCSRELALDLLARGYTVEIVSPNAIPDSLADLELRVESGPSDELTASVEAHDGARSASLEFVHHLKAPMVDFRRRPPEASEAVYFPADPVSFNAEQKDAGDVELPANGSWRAPEPARHMPQILPDPEEAARLIAAPEQLQTVSKEPEQRVRPAVTITIHRSKSKWEQPKLKAMLKPINLPGGWFWRAALTFAGVVLVALVLALGMRRGGTAAGSKGSGIEAQTETNGETGVPARPAATADPNVSGLSAPEHLAAPAVVPAPAPGKGEGQPARASKESPVPKVKAATRPSRHKSSRSHGDDLIARDTIIYFDKPGAKPIPVRESTHHRAHSRKRGGGVITASTVTSLNSKTAPKAGSGK